MWEGMQPRRTAGTRAQVGLPGEKGRAAPSNPPRPLRVLTASKLILPPGLCAARARSLRESTAVNLLKIPQRSESGCSTKAGRRAAEEFPEKDRVTTIYRVEESE